VSASVLDAIARALQLDEAERAHLFHLAQAADGTSAAMRPLRRTTKKWTVRPSLQLRYRRLGAGARRARRAGPLAAAGRAPRGWCPSRV
jgi:hypothetical protein